MNDFTFDAQQPFAAAEFAENPEPRCPCILLLDTSGSMQGNAIAQLNNGLQNFHSELQRDSLSLKRVELGIITFGPVNITQPFTTVDNFSPPILEANGNTPLADAFNTAIQMLNKRKKTLRNNGIKLFRPWIFLITDGEPTDDWQAIPSMVKEGEMSRAFSFFALGVHNANFDVLRQISVREPLKLDGVKFREFFIWLSASLKSVSHSNPGDSVPIPDYKPYGWSEV
ncbi:MAG: vWA domain-containing protein [Pyrinomonadaceae bacterium]